MSTEGDASDLLWFSQVVNEYEVIQFETTKKFVTTDRVIKLDWDNCTISIVRLVSDAGKIMFAIRSKTNRNSDYMGNIPVQLRFMLRIDVMPTEISEPRTERNYRVAASERRNLPQSVKQTIHDRWVFSLGNKAEVWEWTREGMEIRSSKVYRLYQHIRKFLDAPEVDENKNVDKILRVEISKLDEIIPVIYQPAVDSLDNFLREIHCAKIINEKDSSADVEVSLLFNNEQLRKSRLANRFYEWFRKLFYGRVIDIETFKIHFVKDDSGDNYFLFEGIYSGDHTLEFDTIHLDKPPNVIPRPIEYYFADYFHPIVFINTSNHAMAAQDNNGTLWKWEYVPWIKGAPIMRGLKTRKEIDRQFKSLFSRLFGK